jgi:uncharacterized protein
MNEVTDEKLDKYFALTDGALKIVTIKVPKDDVRYAHAEDFLAMARNYLSDAKHFRKKGDYPTALAAASYAHAWLDAGVRSGILDGKGNSRLFTAD